MINLSYIRLDYQIDIIKNVDFFLKVVLKNQILFLGNLNWEYIVFWHNKTYYKKFFKTLKKEEKIEEGKPMLL